MVLDDTVIERMAYRQWRHAIRPKGAGTMNIHNYLPNLSFVMMSSTAGISHHSIPISCLPDWPPPQTVLLKAIVLIPHSDIRKFLTGKPQRWRCVPEFSRLTRYPTAHGLPAVVIDLEIVEITGFVAQAWYVKKQIIDTSLKRGGVGTPLATDHLLRLVENAVREPLRSTPDDSQVVVTCLASGDETDEDSALHRGRRFRTLRLGHSFRSTTSASKGDGADKDNSSFALTQKLPNPNVGGVVGGARVIADALVGKMPDVFTS